MELELSKKELSKQVLDLEKKLDALITDQKVRAYIENLKLLEITQEKLENLHEEIKYERMKHCNHLFVVTNLVSDYSYSGKPFTLILRGCVKCGINNNFQYTSAVVGYLSEDDLRMMELVGSHLDYELKDNEIISTLARASDVYKDIKRNNDELTDKELYNQMRQILSQNPLKRLTNNK